MTELFKALRRKVNDDFLARLDVECGCINGRELEQILDAYKSAAWRMECITALVDHVIEIGHDEFENEDAARVDDPVSDYVTEMEGQAGTESYWSGFATTEEAIRVFRVFHSLIDKDSVEEIEIERELPEEQP